MYVCICMQVHMRATVLGAQKRASDSLELGVVS